METPQRLRAAADETEDVTISHHEYDDGSVVAVDFGPDVEVSVDVVGDTAIVVAGDGQYEFEMPAEATEVSANDGVLTIRAGLGDEGESSGSVASGATDQ